MLSANDLVAEMAKDLATMPEHLWKIIKTAPIRYKVFYIPKRNGELREVAQPAREVKAIQYWLMQNMEEKLPIHSAATAYRKGSSIKENAFLHAESKYLVKMDFKNFFPSILASDIDRHLKANCGSHYDDSATRLIAYVCSWAPGRQRPLRLCIGAPSSPLISNSIMHGFDIEVAKRSTLDEVKYSRYADDLTFSSARKGILERYPSFVEKIAESLAYPRISINERKTVFASRAGKRIVTGLILTPDGKVSIGRDRKRLIRSMYHRYVLGLLSVEEVERLAGLLAFADNVESGYSDRLIQKYFSSYP